MNDHQQLIEYSLEILNIRKNLWPNWPESLTDSLMRALHDEDVEEFKKLIDTGFDVNHPNKRGFSLIHLVILIADLDILDILLQHPDINLNVQYMGETPLILTLKLENFEKAMRLINAGCDVTIPNDDFLTPLHLAVTSNSLELCEALIKRGADVNAVDSVGATPLHVAARDPKLVPIIQMLLFYEADPTCKCYDGYTPFMRGLHSYEVAMELLEYETDFNALTNDDKEYSSLLLALKFKNPIAFEIIERGGDVNYITPSGCYPLQRAIYWNDASMFRTLWSRMDKQVIFYASVPILIFYFSDNCQFNRKEWLDCLYEIFESDVAFDVVDNFASLTGRPFQFVINALINRLIPEEDQIKIIYFFLSHSIPVHVRDVNLLYNKFGYSEEVEALLSEVNERPDSMYNSFLPRLLLTFDSDVNTTAEWFVDYCSANFTLTDFLDEVLPIFRYCTLTDKNKIIYRKVTECELESWGSGGWHDATRQYDELKFKILSKLNYPRVPSLKEIARNAARSLIITKYEINIFFQYQNILSYLKLPRIIKDILKFKVPLYDE